jgi:hypothetical protein
MSNPVWPGSPKVVEVMKFFNLPEHVYEFTIKCGMDRILTIECEYAPSEDEIGVQNLSENE